MRGNSLAGCYFASEGGKVKKYIHGDSLTSSALLDQGAEAFAKKMFKHAQSKTQERWIDREESQKGKKSFTIRWRLGRDPCAWRVTAAERTDGA